MAKKPTIPPELIQFYLPGLEIALQTLVDKLNQIRFAAGLTDPITVSTGDSEVPSPALQGVLESGRGRNLSDEGRAAISAAARRRWAKQKKSRKVYTSQLQPSTVDDLVRWAVKHDNLFDKAAYKEAHPDLSVHAIGGAVARGTFSATKQKGVYRYNE